MLDVAQTRGVLRADAVDVGLQHVRVEHADVLAALGAFVWASYSVVSRRFAAVPSESLCITMLGCAIPAFACHLAFETTLWTLTAVEWVGVFGLGLGSIGLAFVV